MVKTRLLIPRAALLFGLIILAITSVQAQGPWNQIGAGFGGANNPYNPYNNNNDGSSNNNNNNNSNSTTGTNTTTSGNGADSNPSTTYPGEGNHGGTNNDGLPSPPSPPGPGLTAFNGISYASASSYRDAHGILAAAAFAFVFPLGSILMRIVPTKHAWLLHATIQVVAYLIYAAAAAVGLKLVSMMQVQDGATLLSTAGANAHPAIGIVLLVALFVQPSLGAIHHRRFKKVPTRTWVSHAHVWLGRGCVTLGIINGGLGLRLAGAEHAPVVAYSIVAGIMWGLWVFAAAYGEYRRTKRETLQGHVAPKESEAMAAPRIPTPGLGPAAPVNSTAAEASENMAAPAAADLPPYTPGPHYRTHMEQIQQQRERAGGENGDEGGKAEFDVVPIYPTSQEDMYRGQV